MKSKVNASKTGASAHRATAFFGLMALLIVVGPASGQDMTAHAAFECPVTPREKRMYSVTAMAGQYPVWMVDGSFGHWRERDTPMKTLWIIARDHSGDLVVTGRRLDGEGHTLFEGMGTPVGPELIFRNLHEIKIIPGGASQETIDTYAFRTSYVFYPSPGCWEITARLGETTVRIVVELEDRR